MFIVCYSVVNPTSFTNIRSKWLPEVLHHCPNTPIVLVGNKEDLRYDTEFLEEKREMRKEFDYVDPSEGDDVLE